MHPKPDAEKIRFRKEADSCYRLVHEGTLDGTSNLSYIVRLVEGEMGIKLERLGALLGPEIHLAECFARQKRFDEAAAIFKALGNAHAEVEVLRSAIEARQGGTNVPRRLAELMVQYGHPQRAVQLLMETARAFPKGKEDMALLSELAQMLDLTGNTTAAEKVRVRISGMMANNAPTLNAAPPALTPAPSPPTARKASPDGYGFLKALPMFAELTLDDMNSARQW